MISWVPLDFLWSSSGVPLDFLWISFGVPLDFLWIKGIMENTTLIGYGETTLWDNLSEWLRRLTRNQLGSARASSNPAVVAFFLQIQYTFLYLSFKTWELIAFWVYIHKFSVLKPNSYKRPFFAQTNKRIKVLSQTTLLLPWHQDFLPPSPSACPDLPSRFARPLSQSRHTSLGWLAEPTKWGEADAHLPWAARSQQAYSRWIRRRRWNHFDEYSSWPFRGFLEDGCIHGIFYTITQYQCCRTCSSSHCPPRACSSRWHLQCQKHP